MKDFMMIRRSINSGALSLIAVLLLGNAGQANDVIEAAGRFTVKITTAVDYSFGNEKKGTWRGSGFLVDRERGWILTNAHVAGKSPSTVRVSFTNTLICRNTSAAVPNTVG